jgi:DNA polymerase-3 subunit gamma/tau
MLGSVEQRHIHALLHALAERQPATAIAAIAEVFAQARSLSQLLSDLAEGLHRIALVQQVPDYRDDSRSDWDELLALAALLNPEDVQLFYQIAATGRRDLSLAPSERSGCEMTLLRMFAFAPAGSDTSPTAGLRQEAGSAAVDAGSRKAGASGAAPAARVPDAAEDEPLATPPAASPSSARQSLSPESWAQVLPRLNLGGPVATVAAMLALVRVSPGQIEFTVGADDLFMVTDRFRSTLEKSLAEFCGQSMRIVIAPAAHTEVNTPARMEQVRLDETRAAAEQAIEQDPLIQRLRSRFDAEVLRDSIRPLDTRSH